MPTYYAHTGRDDRDRRDWHLLREHLIAVAQGAALRAEGLTIGGVPLREAAYLAGLLHDLGKYRPGFQEKLRGIAVSRIADTYHKQAGAALAYRKNHPHVAWAIAGHHGGLPDPATLEQLIPAAQRRSMIDEVWPIATQDCPDLAAASWAGPPPNRPHFDLAVRLLFSCLVDADWDDTGAHAAQVRGWTPDPSPPRLTRDLAQSWLDRLDQHVNQLAADCNRPEVRRARDDVYRAALSAADHPPGLFSLEVPTGGGKTLSSLAFALKHIATHAESNGLRRILYVAPFLTILEQNAQSIRKALGLKPSDLAMLEHHSLADADGPAPPTALDDSEGDNQNEAQRAAAARRAENWDAPLVLTSNVQFFESLFSNRPGRCRKLHNIARSVILLDECQAVPAHLLAPTCAMLHQLVTDLGCTIVLASATQPTLDHRKLQEAGCALPTPRPITPTDLNLAQRLQRVRVSWPEKDQALGWVEVAALMTARPAALGVVNTTRAARELFQVLKAQRPDDAFHLSAKMCPAHRMEVLQKALDRIKEKRPCYLISTQLIEAGVDVDFPMVLRELAPFDAIIQAAGRCNREGLLNGPDGTPGGELVVFRSRAFVENQRRYYPQGYWYKQGLHVLEQDTGLYLGTPPDVHSSADLADYFTRFYYAGDLDREQIQVRRAKFQFAEVATHYRIIEDSGESVLVTNWPGHTDEVAPLLAAYEANPSRANLRRLAPYQVNVRFARKEAHPLIDLETYSVPTWTGGYDADTGLADERDVEDFLF